MFDELYCEDPIKISIKGTKIPKNINTETETEKYCKTGRHFCMLGAFIDPISNEIKKTCNTCKKTKNLKMQQKKLQNQQEESNIVKEELLPCSTGHHDVPVSEFYIGRKMFKTCNTCRKKGNDKNNKRNK